MDVPWLWVHLTECIYIYIYIHIFSWVLNPTRNDTHPFVKNPGTVHNVFFCGLVFWISGRVPRWVIPRTFPRRFQLKHRWKILGSKEHQCFDGRALAISTVSWYVFGLNAIWIWRCEWWQFLLIMFFFVISFLNHDPVAGNDPIWWA